MSTVPLGRPPAPPRIPRRPRSPGRHRRPPTRSATDPTVPAQTRDRPRPGDRHVVRRPGRVINTGRPTRTTPTSSSTPRGRRPAGPGRGPGRHLTVDRLKPSLGDVVTLKVTVTNDGQVEATNVAATVTLPAGMTFVSSDAGANKFDPATGTWTPGHRRGPGDGRPDPQGQGDRRRHAGSVTAAISHADQADDRRRTTTRRPSPVTPVLGQAEGGQVGLGRVGRRRVHGRDGRGRRQRRARARPATWW